MLTWMRSRPLRLSVALPCSVIVNVPVVVGRTNSEGKPSVPLGAVLSTMMLLV